MEKARGKFDLFVFLLPDKTVSWRIGQYLHGWIGLPLEKWGVDDLQDVISFVRSNVFPELGARQARVSCQFYSHEGFWSESERITRVSYLLFIVE